tara:strand:- start:73 stop:213 length:141 start_codon:yes stop_codon:yes gene_type:complete
MFVLTQWLAREENYQPDKAKKKKETNTNQEKFQFFPSSVCPSHFPN